VKAFRDLTLLGAFSVWRRRPLDTYKVTLRIDPIGAQLFDGRHHLWIMIMVFKKLDGFPVSKSELRGGLAAAVADWI